jgi:hypothetical protein
MRALDLTRALTAALALALSGGACSAIVAGAPGPLRCDGAAGNPCPEGLFCSVDGLCVESGCNPDEPDICNGNDDDCDGETDEGGASTPACATGVCVRGVCRPDCMPEVCNGVDDDCDDRIDNGLDVDMDGDGAPACDFANPAQQDCNDRNNEVFPTANERCNGVDDDCDRTTSDDLGCTDGRRCVVAEGEVMPGCFALGDCRAFPSACGMGTVCSDAGTCVPSMGCAPNTRCSETAYCNAAEMCVPLLEIGQNCQRDVQCASGRCYDNGALGIDGAATGGTRVCGAPCCADADCAGLGAGLECYAPGTGARSCLPLALIPGGAPPEACSTNADCPGGACRILSTSAGLATLACGGAGDDGACGRAADCPPFNACVYRSPDDDTSWVTTCEFTIVSGSSGRDCDYPFECRDELCFLGQCVDTCCRDSHCGAGFRCAPIDNDGWEMRCLPIPEILL